MTAWLIVYIAGVVILTYVDAVLCFAMKRRFRVWGSLAVGLVWPILAPCLIVGTAKHTRNWPDVGK